ncbi:MAG: DUF4922 domain-containing protein [Paludibacteraceae bacterium]|nr:DUF4922 domain-containing protein [Paludibacteraceae bacterium]
MTSSLQKAIEEMFERQLSSWPLAYNNFQALQEVEEKTFHCNGYNIRIQHNPARAVSSGAKVDAKSIAARPCFLCEQNRPEEQDYVRWNNYDILVNPFPIFHNHLTIAWQEHQPQELRSHLSDMIDLAQMLDGYTIFYNGPQCGASAPDHMHFQAGENDGFPLVQDFEWLKQQTEPEHIDNALLYRIGADLYQRTVWVVCGKTPDEVMKVFDHLIPDCATNEPLLNVLCNAVGNTIQLFIFPRKAFRPWQYSAEGEDRLMVSPATVELSGVVITPRKEDFEKITLDDVQSIFQQITL